MLARFGAQIWHCLAGGLLTLFAMANTGAHAQAPGSPGRPPPREERPDFRTAAVRAAESYDPAGIRLGSFRLFPLLELDEGYNDNVFAVPSASGQTTSFAQFIKPALELKSTWASHMLNLYARGNFAFYTAAPAQNFQDFAVGAEGRVDIQRNWNTYGTLSFNRAHEDPGSPNTVSGSTNVTVYNQLTGNVGYYQKINRLSGRAEFRADNFSYYNNGLGLSNGVIPNSDRDHTELRESLRGGYEFLDGYEIWVRGTLNQRLYVNPIDAAGFAHNSSGWDAVAGITIDVGGLTTAELFAGYLQQNYVDARFRPLQGAQFGAAAYWNPLKELWVAPYIKRTVNETAYVGDSGYLYTAFGLNVNYNVRPNIRLNGLGDYSIADYQNFSSSNRLDQYVTFAAGVMYLPMREFFVGPQYQYVYRTSNQPGLDYGQNVIMLRLGARL